ncbi:MAG: 1-phosphofructokinase family hexose kinase [Bacteroidota bacterium]
MITTVTLNPMVDKTVHVEALTRGSIQRAASMTMVAGGKGINVSRQLRALGAETIASGFLGGVTGKMIRALMDQEGIRHDFVETEMLTREGVTYLETDGTATAVFEPAQKPPVDCVHALSKKINALAQESEWIVCSGSSPGGEADDVFYEAILSAHKAACRSVLDSYGAALTLAVKGLPTLLKTNKAEFEQSHRLVLRNENDIRRELGKLIDIGVRYSILTDGPGPVYSASKEGEWKITPPGVRPINPVGSGDAMVAGMLYGFTKAWDFERCLRFGVAAGAANARVWQVAGSSYEEIIKDEMNVRVQKLA